MEKNSFKINSQKNQLRISFKQCAKSFMNTGSEHEINDHFLQEERVKVKLEFLAGYSVIQLPQHIGLLPLSILFAKKRPSCP
jgi:hypothetical protein